MTRREKNVVKKCKAIENKIEVAKAFLYQKDIEVGLYMLKCIALDTKSIKRVMWRGKKIEVKWLNNCASTTSDNKVINYTFTKTKPATNQYVLSKKGKKK